MNLFKKIKNFVSMTGSSIRDIFTGNILTKENLKKHLNLMLLLFLLAFCYVGNQLNCEQKKREIARLQIKRENARIDALTISSELMGMCKQSQVYQMLKDRNNGDMLLIESVSSPYKIEK